MDSRLLPSLSPKHSVVISLFSIAASVNEFPPPASEGESYAANPMRACNSIKSFLLTFVSVLRTFFLDEEAVNGADAGGGLDMMQNSEMYTAYIINDKM